MEIAFFTDSYPPTRDGVASVVASLARELRQQGHRVRIFAPRPDASLARDAEAEPDVVRFRSVPVPMYGVYRWAVFPFLRLRAKGVADVDVLHFHSPGMMGNAGFLAARRFNRPLVGTFHTDIAAMRDSFPATPSVRLFFRVGTFYSLGLYWRCDRTTAPSDAARRRLETQSRKPYRRPIEVIPNGIEVERFRPGLATPAWRDRLRVPAGAPVATFLGRLTIDKGVHRFLDAFGPIAARHGAFAIVGGSGPEETRVRARIGSEPALRESVRFVGRVAELEKPALLAQSDLFVLPSTSDTSSIALLEAMACGTPVVATRAGGLPEVVDDGVTGRLVEPGDPAALVRTLDELLGDGSARRRLGSAAREHVIAHASIAATARRFITLYENLLREGGSSGSGDV